jgi:3-isopropylmalate/(R)-2-methylmalate dehydratase small subunit
MKPFTTLESRVLSLIRNDVDTDQIIPARFLKVTDKNGLKDCLFWDWRRTSDGSLDPNFILNKPEAAGCQVLLSGVNFGCGSSREHAPWALADFGFRAVVAVSFADIFRNNALKNGLLPVAVPEDVVNRLAKAVAKDGACNVRIDLRSETMDLPDGEKVRFDVDAFSKTCLLNGQDQLGYLQSFADRVRDFEQARGDVRG